MLLAFMCKYKIGQSLYKNFFLNKKCFDMITFKLKYRDCLLLYIQRRLYKHKIPITLLNCITL